MTAVRLTLHGRIPVVAAPKAVQQLSQLGQLTGAHTTMSAVIHQLSRLAATGALPVRLSQNRKGDWSVEAYTRYHMVRLFPTKYGDAYMIGAVDRITFRDQERLVRGALILHCQPGWELYPELRDVPKGMGAHWLALLHVWTSMAENRPTSTMPHHHETFLDLLTKVVEASRDIETARQREAAPIPYRRMDSAKEQRHSARGVYTFSLLRPTQLAAGSMVYLGDDRVQGDVDAAARLDQGRKERAGPRLGNPHGHIAGGGADPRSRWPLRWVVRAWLRS